MLPRRFERQITKKTQDLLNKILDDELKASKGRPGKKRTLSQVNNDVDEAEEACKKAKTKRTEGARQFALCQEKKEQLFLTLLEKSVGVLETTNFLIKNLSGDIYPTQPLVSDPIRSAFNKNFTDEEEQEEEDECEKSEELFD